MKRKEQLIRLVISLARIFFILLTGIFLLFILNYFLYNRIIFELLCIFFLVILLGIVSLVVSEVIHYQIKAGREDNFQYTLKELTGLYVKSYLVIVSGVGLGYIYSLQQASIHLIPNILFYSFDSLLTIYALYSIVQGEKLREINNRRIESENALLKSQLNPHFLFNTLNNIDALIQFNPQKASDTVIKLSSLLRYITYQSNLSTVLLSNEITHLEEYIQLQQLRFTSPDNIHLTVNMDDDTQKIAPMLLMPFIENIFKHTNRQSLSPINIDIEVKGHQLCLKTQNPCIQNERVKTEGGVGLKIVQKRLKLLYPKKYQLQINQDSDNYQVYLQITLQ